MGFPMRKLNPEWGEQGVSEGDVGHQGPPKPLPDTKTPPRTPETPVLTEGGAIARVHREGHDLVGAIRASGGA